ncbi:Gfo/Idh/MocA family protein [Candidatus Enterococcus ferrettii]|uniref:Gfo/Idh/MocA-like oxidoreductase N-terminal domain-containing protein n=1 Tax=Candidatus Enterococcus ferrettii TaxID=2815324 RepID=A0ABV0EWE8_9ENTE|nr:Gfo/Idh/MocA family oxidoreductase [Enterococcus sp. 665A]MBO1342781.1 Gfo/Idh/MocA family oxidoreductase [Enterococcus sp. 665A]
MRIGIIGLGSMGKRRLRLIQDNFSEKIVCGIDTNLSRRQEVNAEYNITVFENLEEAKEKFDIDSVFVCTSPATHETIIIQALNLDCHVFTEINLMNSYYEKITDLSKKLKKVLYLSSTFLKREEINYIKARLKNKNNYIYRYHVGQYLPDWHPWENYQDFFVSNKLTNGCRELLAIEFPWITETFSDIEKVESYSRSISNLQLDFPDTYSLLLRHSNGVIGTITVDIVSRTAKRDLTIISEEDQIEWGGNPNNLLAWDMNSSTMKKIELYKEIQHDDNYSHTIIEDAYLEEIREFFDVVSGDTISEYTFEKDDKIINLINQIEGLA